MDDQQTTTAPHIIHARSAKFTEHRDTYKRGDYNETQLRRDFLDPFFAALGWNIDNRKGYADALRVELSEKARDYCFLICGQRGLFVEARKPGVNIE